MGDLLLPVIIFDGLFKDREIQVQVKAIPKKMQKNKRQWRAIKISGGNWGTDRAIIYVSHWWGFVMENKEAIEKPNLLLIILGLVFGENYSLVFLINACLIVY